MYVDFSDCNRQPFHMTKYLDLEGPKKGNVKYYCCLQAIFLLFNHLKWKTVENVV